MKVRMRNHRAAERLFLIDIPCSPPAMYGTMASLLIRFQVGPHHDECHEQRKSHQNLIGWKLLGAECLAKQVTQHDDDSV